MRLPLCGAVEHDIAHAIADRLDTGGQAVVEPGVLRYHRGDAGELADLAAEAVQHYRRTGQTRRAEIAEGLHAQFHAVAVAGHYLPLADVG